MTPRNSLTMYQSRYNVCGVLMAFIVLTAVPAMIRNHSLCGYWLSSENGDHVHVNNNGQCQFKLSEYSGESAGRFWQDDGFECYRAGFKYHRTDYAVVLCGHPLNIFLGIAKADVVLCAPWHDPSEYGCYVLNIGRLIQAFCIIICVPLLALFTLRSCRVMPD